MSVKFWPSPSIKQTKDYLPLYNSVWTEEHPVLWLYQRVARWLRGVNNPRPLGTGEASPGVLCSGLGSPEQGTSTKGTKSSRQLLRWSEGQCMGGTPTAWPSRFMEDQRCQTALFVPVFHPRTDPCHPETAHAPARSVLPMPHWGFLPGRLPSFGQQGSPWPPAPKGCFP